MPRNGLGLRPHIKPQKPGSSGIFAKTDEPALETKALERALPRRLRTLVRVDPVLGLAMGSGPGLADGCGGGRCWMRLQVFACTVP